MVTQAAVKKLLATYGKAWTTQDPDLILTIFTKGATYAERAFQKPYKGHKEIRKYWEEKVVKEQSNIKFKLLHTYIEGETVIAEWDAMFTIKPTKARKHIREVAILELKDGKISSLREYWQSEERPKPI